MTTSIEIVCKPLKYFVRYHYYPALICELHKSDIVISFMLRKERGGDIFVYEESYCHSLSSNFLLPVNDIFWLEVENKNSNKFGLTK